MARYGGGGGGMSRYGGRGGRGGGRGGTYIFRGYISFFLPRHLLIQSLAGFTSSNAAPLGSNRRW